MARYSRTAVYTLSCEDCDLRYDETTNNPSEDARKHYKETGHLVAVRRVESWIYKKPESPNP